jgi:hypothetical protein
MKTKVLFISLAFGLLALAGWLDHAPKPAAQANEVPEKYRETVRKARQYLEKSQFKDGHWEGDGGNHPVAMTGLVGIALLMETMNPRPTQNFGLRSEPILVPTNSTNIRKGVDWLMDKSQAGRDGLIFSDHPSERARYMEGHGLATLFLAGAVNGERDEARRKRLTDVLTRAVKYIVKSQSSQGGWYHTSKAEGHDFDAILPTAIQIQALQAAENAGIPIPGATLSDAQAYLKMALAKEEPAKAGPNRNRPTETAAALACRAVGWPAAQIDDVREKWLKDCQAQIPVGREMKFGRDDLAHYYYAQAVFNAEKSNGEKPKTSWNAYRTAMFDHLQSSQNKDGSWPASDGIGAGPVYATALWCTILQLDHRSHPSRSRLDDIVIITRRRELLPKGQAADAAFRLAAETWLRRTEVKA